MLRFGSCGTYYGCQKHEPEAGSEVPEKMDRQHRKYYQFYTGEKWGKPENYDLCINSANYGIKETIDVIRRMIGK